MPVPSTRTPVRVARGTYSNLSTVDALASLQEGEVCFATDEQKLYVKQGGGLTSISASSTASPAPSDVTASPAFASGTGTQADPFVVTSAAVPFSGGTAESAQEITLTGTAGDFVLFTDNSVTASGDRFSGQVVGNVDSGGTFKFKLKYEDAPGTTVNNTTYNGLVQIGTAHFSFTVVQSNLTALTEDTSSTISGTLGVGSVLTCTPGTATGGTGTITYTTKWQRSFNGVDGFFDISGATGDTYTQQNTDAGYFVRAVTTATDNTPAGQGGPLTLEMPSGATSNIPTGAAPVINNVVLSEDNTGGARFTGETFSVDLTMGNNGTPVSEKAVKATVTANFAQFPTTDAVSSISQDVSPPTFTSSFTNQLSSNFTEPSSSYRGFGSLELLDFGTTVKIAAFHASGNSLQSDYPIYKIFDFANNTFSSPQNYRNGLNDYAAASIQYAKKTIKGVRPNGDRFVNFPGQESSGYGHTLLYNDTSDSGYPARDPRSFEIIHSDGTWYYGGTDQALGGGYIFRQRPGESSATSQQWSWTNQGRHYSAVEWNNEMWIFTYRWGNGYLYWYKENPADVTWTSSANLVAYGQEQVGGSSTYSKVNDTFIHKNTLFYVGGQRLYKYNPSTNSFGSHMTDLGTSGNNSIQSWYHDDDYLYVQTLFTATGTPYWYRSNNLGVTWTPWWYGQSSALDLGDYRSKKGCNFLEALGHSFWGAKEEGGSQNYEIHYKETNRQTLTFASNTELENINPGDFMRVTGTTDINEYAYVRSVDAANSQMTINKTTSVTAGQQLETLATTGNLSSTKFLVIDATGNISGYQGADPGFVTQSTATEIDLTFPSTFPSGNAPDDEFAAGTVMQVTAQASNNSGTHTFNSNQVTPS